MLDESKNLLNIMYCDVNSFNFPIHPQLSALALVARFFVIILIFFASSHLFQCGEKEEKSEQSVSWN